MDNSGKDIDPKSTTNPENGKTEIELPTVLKDILKDPSISEEKRRAIIKAVTHYTSISSFQGPIPPPDILRGYNEVIPNGADRILTMAEKQSNHRIQLEDHVIKEELCQSRRGQNFGLTIAVISIVISSILAYFGHITVPSILGGSTIVSLVTVFVIGKRIQKKDLEEKDE